MENKCIFCEIAAGRMETPGVFWKDEEFMAFLSIFPSVKGFAVIIPKKHYGSDVLALPDDVLQRLILASKKVSKMLMEVMEDVGRVGLVMEGTGIDHAHIKLIPMHDTAHMREGVWKPYASGKSDYFEKYPGYLSSADGPAADPEEIKKLADKLRNCTC